MTPHTIPVGGEPPPMDDGTAAPPTRRTGKPKGKTPGARRRAGERFTVLNTFVDFALKNLSRVEIAVWLILFRDTREGTARTSYDDIARRAGCNRRNVGCAVRRLEQRG